jgi:hypothetical protein
MMKSSEPQIGFKKSSIRRHLAAKIDDWLKTIKDENLAHDIEKDIIVTGGSITSMLLGEKVNDYDIYFRTLETAERVAKYYVDQFNESVTLPTNGTAPCNPDVKRKVIKNCKGVEEERVVIYIKSAGVAAEAQETYKYFEAYHGDRAEDFADSLNESPSKDKPRYRPIFMSQNAITLSDKIQLIIRFAGAPDVIHTNFDFIHATCWYEYHENILVLPPAALECMLARSLVYSGSLYPIASIFRSKKFINRGWRITAGQLLKIMWQISEINLKDMEVLQEQLTGVDQAYMYQLVNALQGVDPDKINSAYVAVIIDRIFE